jgi:hypothetical protein
VFLVEGLSRGPGAQSVIALVDQNCGVNAVVAAQENTRTSGERTPVPGVTLEPLSAELSARVRLGYNPEFAVACPDTGPMRFPMVL